jgi:LCCL domain
LTRSKRRGHIHAAWQRLDRGSIGKGGMHVRRELMVSIGIVVCLGGFARASAQVDITWSKNATSYRGRSGPIVVTCPAEGRAGQVWGTDTYTDDSSICTAAVHAGVITFADGGTLTLQARPGLTVYRGSRRNGVTTMEYAEWEGSFSVARYIEPEPTRPPPAPAPPPVIPWSRTAVGLAPNGRRFTFRCRPPAKDAPIIGIDAYSWESSICAAAVHAGMITASVGGTVMIEMRPGEPGYPGSPRNGVTSTAGNGTILSFVFVTSVADRR